jgi:hypothetical protein
VKDRWAVRATALCSTLLLGLGLQASAAPSVTGGGRQRPAFSRYAGDLLPASLPRLTASRGVLPPPKFPAVKNNFEVVGHVRFKGGNPEGDVYFFDHGAAGKYAYVGTVGPGAPGVRIVRVTRPSRPKLVATAKTRREVDYQDVVVVRIGDRVIMGVGLQPTGERGRGGGLALFNVTKPARPRLLSVYSLPRFDGVHELDLAPRADGGVLALLAVPFAEANALFGGGPDIGGDLQILDITKPRAPVKVADWGIIADSTLPRANGAEEIEFPGQGLGFFPLYFLHSVRSADGGATAYASYWDAGEIKFDLNDPADPKVIGRTTYAFDDDGDAHSMTPYDAGGNRYILQNDEDFAAESPATVTSSATGTSTYPGLEEWWLPTTLTQAGDRSGSLHDAGDGCQAEDYAGATPESIVLVDFIDPFFNDTSPCGKVRQMTLAAGAGVTTLLINLVSEERPFVFPPRPRAVRRLRQAAPDLVVVDISSLDDLAERLRAQTGGVTVSIEAGTPSFGFLRVYEESTTDTEGDGVFDFEQVGKFDDLPHVAGEYPPPPGGWTIHNTEVNGTRAYSSWYSHGIVALDVSSPTAPTLTGQFVPPSKSQRQISLGVGRALVWGVAVDPTSGVVYASDMRTGLWIIRPTGAAASP